MCPQPLWALGDLDHLFSVSALIGSLTFGVALFLCLASGKICHRFGCRLSHAIGTLTCTAALIITSWATGITFMFFSLCLMYGVGMTLTQMACFLIVSMYFDKRRSFALGVLAMGASASFFAIGPIMETVVNSVGWRNALRILSGFMFCTCLY